MIPPQKIRNLRRFRRRCWFFDILKQISFIVRLAFSTKRNPADIPLKIFTQKSQGNPIPEIQIRKSNMISWEITLRIFRIYVFTAIRPLSDQTTIKMSIFGYLISFLLDIEIPKSGLRFPCDFSVNILSGISAMISLFLWGKPKCLL